MDPKEKVHEILKKFRTAMFVSGKPGGEWESRPMQVAKVEDNGDLWFFTNKSGRLADELDTNPAVLLVLQEDGSYYLSLRGNARKVHDASKIRELFSEPYKVWFPGGPDDPQLLLIGVNPVSAEYWDTAGTNKLQYMFEAVKAYVKGTTPELRDDPDHHAKTRL
ncbi:MAG: pyridoxamine 5'-phosphate oxidase family protein [Bryobacteraceae bacterium]